MTTTEFNERDRGILALQYSRFDVEIAREVEMLLDRVSRAAGENAGLENFLSKFHAFETEHSEKIDQLRPCPGLGVI